MCKQACVSIKMEILGQLAVTLALTLVIEITVAILLKVRSIYDIIFLILINCITNPTVNVIYGLVIGYTDIEAGSLTGWVIVLILEFLVWLTEAVMIKKLLEYRRIKPMLLSLILNAASFLMGLVMF